MKLLSICLFFLAGLFCVHALAGEVSEIELVDGSKIYGEVVSFSDGVYKVKTKGLGTIQIEESKIRVLRLKPEVVISGNVTLPGSAESASNTSEIQALQHSMLSNTNLLDMILSLQNDPDFQEILKDPVIMEAVNSGNISALISNPKFMKLLSNPKVQEIQKNVTGK
jgi:hypothetical protein